jgi:FixJ family two-component response regulator
MAKRRRQFLVAVVDDDAGVGRALQDLFDSHGLPARCFSSAEQFLRSPQGRKAGCVILDMQLPGMSGLELQRKLRVSGLTIPVIFSTAADDIDGQLRAQLLKDGAIDVLPKPTDPVQLLRLVQAALQAGRRS